MGPSSLIYAPRPGGQSWAGCYVCAKVDSEPCLLGYTDAETNLDVTNLTHAPLALREWGDTCLL